MVSNLFFAFCSKTTEALPSFPQVVGKFNGGVQRLSLTEKELLQVDGLHCPFSFALEHDELDRRHLVDPAEEPDQQDDGNRDPDQPEQKTSTHWFLFGLPKERPLGSKVPAAT